MPTQPLTLAARSAELSSSVQPLETSGESHDTSIDRSHHPLSLQSRTQARVHAPHQRSRRKLIGDLWTDGADDLGRRALRIAACCQLAAIRVRGDGTPGVDLARCRDRLCPLCSGYRGRECCQRVVDLTAKCDCLRFGTLTLAHDGASLSDRVTRILMAFRDLRKSDTWRQNVRGCVATLEVTMGGDIRHWHVHLHFIWDGDFMPQPKLKQAWHEATGDSYIVHIKAVHGRRQAAHYIAAYVAKPCEVHKWTEAEVREYARALHGRRLLATSGSFHGQEPDQDTIEDVPPPSTHLCGVHAVHAAEHAGCEHTRHAADVLARMGVSLAMALDRPSSSLDTSLPPVDRREVVFAFGVLAELNSCFPKRPDPGTLERIRRHAFGVPEPAPPPKERQSYLQDRSGW